MAFHNQLGKWGEDLAAEKLAAEGYAIVERSWRYGRHEIDIIAMKDDELVIAEVKTRSNSDEDPLDAVDDKKIQSMIRGAEVYCQMKNLPHAVRFDLFSINGTPDNYTLEHICDAFYPPLKTYR